MAGRWLFSDNDPSMTVSDEGPHECAACECPVILATRPIIRPGGRPRSQWSRGLGYFLTVEPPATSAARGVALPVECRAMPVE